MLKSLRNLFILLILSSLQIQAQNRVLDKTIVHFGENAVVFIGGNTTIDNPLNVTEDTSASVTFTNDLLTASDSLLTLNGQVTFEGNSQQTCQPNLSVGRLYIENPNGISFYRNVLAQNKLYMLGGEVYMVNGSIISIGTASSNPGTLNYLSGHINGKMSRWFASNTNSGDATGLFPLGVDSNDRFLKVEYTGAPGTPGQLISWYDTSKMTGGGATQSVAAAGSCSAFTSAFLNDEGFWYLDTNQLSGGTFNITLVGEGLSNINQICEVTALNKNYASISWAQNGMHMQPSGTTSRPVLERSGANLYNQWGFAGGTPNPLPVTWLSFNAVKKANTSYLTWTTATEINNHYFDVERTVDGKTWKKIGQVQGAGNSSTILNYNFTDIKPEIGVNFYRLKQVDYNGTFDYSEIRSVNFNDKITGISVFPNPSDGRIDIVLTPDLFGSLSITDASGRMVFEKDIQNTHSVLDLSNLAEGMYFIHVSGFNYKLFKH